MTATSCGTCAAVEKRPLRGISEREIAIALVLHYAESECISFSLMGFYDDDFDFLQGLAERLGVSHDKPMENKLRRVVRRLVQYGVLHAHMGATAKEYIDEPSKQMNYKLKPGKAHLMLQPHRPGITMGPEGEAEYLLRHAYPAP